MDEKCSVTRKYFKQKWNPEKHKLPGNPYVVSYIDYLNKFVMIFDIDKKNEDGIWNGTPPELELGELYYFQNTQKHIFPYYMDNRYILGRLYRVYPSDNSDMGNPWIPGTGGNVNEYTALYWFWIVGVFDHEVDLLRNTRLNGFKNVIDDNRYFDRIPKTNEVIHYDNGIISNSKVSVDYSIPTDPDKWDEFTLCHFTELDKTFSILKMLKHNHERPER